MHGTALKLVVKGQSYLEPGDLIEFNIRPIDADNTDIEEDHRYSGQYVITKIRHQITSDIYTMVLECAKDSVVNPVVAGEPQYKQIKTKGDLEDIYDSSQTSTIDTTNPQTVYEDFFYEHIVRTTYQRESIPSSKSLSWTLIVSQYTTWRFTYLIYTIPKYIHEDTPTTQREYQNYTRMRYK